MVRRGSTVVGRILVSDIAVVAAGFSPCGKTSDSEIRPAVKQQKQRPSENP
ncbi:co-chaperone GrpE [Neisseria bacilliformis ATCC BAA-1200]|uniref:Co-chaperone GrpE n=1 Tax=Neisseria bacilliformis ATCC BAA-1200 TaxID=888742 RepID=F2BEK6_9NEIS|nr:co-chaperone GrpE [Neisseria bacilliformis ATCC BAA-1200]